MNHALLDTLLALDMLTLSAHTLAAGDAMSAVSHRQLLAERLQDSHCLTVYGADGSLHGYAMLRALDDGHWFVGMFNLHPAQRNRRVMSALVRQIAALPGMQPDSQLQSHVYRSNAASLRFHYKLGFRVQQENDKAIAFIACAQDLLARLPPIKESA